MTAPGTLPPDHRPALGRPGSRRQGRALVPWEGPPPARVLVLRFSALGDVLLTTPALEALRAAWPAAQLWVATKARFAPLLERHPAVTGVVGLAPGEGVRAFAARLAAHGPFDALLDLHGKLRSRALRLFLQPVRRAVVWKVRDRLAGIPVQLGVLPYRADAREADRFHAAAEELAGRRLGPGLLRAVPAPEAVARAEALLRAAGIDPARPLLGLSPGSAKASKRWPVERFADLAARAASAGLQVAVQGSAEEEPLGRAVRARAPAAADLCGKLDVAGLLGFVSRCSAFVANDTGPMHVARALGVPTLAIFSSTDPGLFSWEGHRALAPRGLDCAPCSFHGRDRCPRGHLHCLSAIEAEEAWAALQPLLAGGPRALLGA